MKLAFYIIYNFLYQIFSFWLLLLVGTYYNEGIISACLFWKTDKGSAVIAQYGPIKAFAFIIEAAILITLIYIVNRLILSDTEIKSRSLRIANRTAVINIIASLFFLGLMIFSK